MTILILSLSFVFKSNELNIVYMIRLFQIKDILKAIDEKFRIDEQYPIPW